MTNTYLLMSGPDGYTDPWGSSWPANVRVARILWDGIAPYTPSEGLLLVPDDDGPVYQAPVPPPTTISALDFIGRFTVAEQSALMSAKPMWGVLIAAATIIDVTDPRLLTDIAAAVTVGLLTEARSVQILDLTVASP